MYKITPNYPNVIDAMTGQAMPTKGITREVLLPPDHVAERSGDVVITAVIAAPPGKSASETASVSSDTKSSKTKL